MRYENQNPQYIYLLEKIEELENQLRLKEDNVIFMGKLAGKYLDKHIDLQMKTKDFNRLPWYKKMFFKFKI